MQVWRSPDRGAIEHADWPTGRDMAGFHTVTDRVFQSVGSVDSPTGGEVRLLPVVTADERPNTRGGEPTGNQAVGWYLTHSVFISVTVAKTVPALRGERGNRCSAQLVDDQEVLPTNGGRTDASRTPNPTGERWPDGAVTVSVLWRAHNNGLRGGTIGRRWCGHLPRMRQGRVRASRRLTDTASICGSTFRVLRPLSMVANRTTALDGASAGRRRSQPPGAPLSSRG